jgi:alkylation response protein AidB-like acyl-CoA dehydrogenase
MPTAAWARATTPLRVDRAQAGHHASPTAVLAFGDHGGAVGYLVGEENRGLEYMFIMMNAARFGVGMEGMAVCRARLPAGRDYAKRPHPGHRHRRARWPKVPIINHPMCVAC